MTMLYEARTLHVQIDCEPTAVYCFVANLENFPRWATSFCQSIRQTAGAWVAVTPQGEVTIRLAPANSCGVLDHYVAPAGGAEVYVPLRVVANGSGSEVLFTLFRLPAMSDADYAADAALVEQDLASLKQVLEH
jgi:hypothetical protein